ncbi:hypothetical protein BV25DRAFT_1841337 [Artomyces pyxidatus]|uniref:Uncharacterized protein n=1 Tax=Artomyces pyxidatus TaxID=48021 RepID=A0ACB8SMU4_9AGAM|nr:hypothetical protein BV25DRAFT_1841337 [Artomyces pyxidatus]
MDRARWAYAYGFAWEAEAACGGVKRVAEAFSRCNFEGLRRLRHRLDVSVQLFESIRESEEGVRDRTGSGQSSATRRQTSLCTVRRGVMWTVDEALETWSERSAGGGCTASDVGDERKQNEENTPVPSTNSNDAHGGASWKTPERLLYQQVHDTDRIVSWSVRTCQTCERAPMRRTATTRMDYKRIVVGETRRPGKPPSRNSGRHGAGGCVRSREAKREWRGISSPVRGQVDGFDCGGFGLENPFRRLRVRAQPSCGDEVEGVEHREIEDEGVDRTPGVQYTKGGEPCCESPGDHAKPKNTLACAIWGRIERQRNWGIASEARMKAAERWSRQVGRECTSRRGRKLPEGARRRRESRGIALASAEGKILPAWVATVHGRFLEKRCTGAE